VTENIQYYFKRPHRPLDYRLAYYYADMPVAALPKIRGLTGENTGKTRHHSLTPPERSDATRRGPWVMSAM
jgi:hypothetical protein